MKKSWFITIQIVVKCKSLTKFAQFLQQKKLTTQNIFRSPQMDKAEIQII